MINEIPTYSVRLVSSYLHQLELCVKVKHSQVPVQLVHCLKMEHAQCQDYSSESLSSTPNSLKAVVVELQETDKLVNGSKSYAGYASTPSTGSTSASPTPYKVSSRELTIAMLGAAAGNCMEWYNFSLFGLLANVFGMLCCIMEYEEIAIYKETRNIPIYFTFVHTTCFYIEFT